MANQTNGLLSPWLRSRRIAAARPFLRGRVLDFGCGEGYLAALVAKERYVGFDTDDGSIQRARTLFPGYVFEGLLTKHKSFDTIVALAVLEHLENPGAILRDLTSRLTPGGTIMLTTPHAAFEWIHTAGSVLGLFSQHARDDHETLFNEQGLRSVVKNAGLSLVFYNRFLWGANQLAVLQKNSGSSTDPSIGQWPEPRGAWPK